MLDHCSISHKGGVALIEGRTSDGKYEKDGYAVKWTFVNDLELIFVVAYQRILQLTYVDELLVALKALFIKLFQPFLASFSAVVEAPTPWNFAKAFEGWDAYFDKLLHDLENKSARVHRVHSTNHSIAPTHARADVQDEEQIARNVHALKNRLRGRGGQTSRRGRGRVDAGSGRDSVPGSDSETTPNAKRKSKAKTQRKWGNEAPTDADMASLDYSYDSTASDGRTGTPDLSTLVDNGSLGTRTQDGLYEVKDWEFVTGGKSPDDVIAEVLRQGGEEPKPTSSSLGALGSIFARLTGSKVLSEEDLKPVLEAMKQHLMKKNVAKEISDKVVRIKWAVTATTSAVRQALANSITRILTPKTSTDLLLSIRTKLSALSTTQQRLPYSITFVGVNGVGKSTNLSKVCFWLIQNGFRVLIAACDTFRSGAVEQLRVHVRNLGMLGVDGATTSKGRVELYERGYGKDAAGIAKEAIAYARDNEFDVVLIDTAGRMQDNEPLMRALAKLVASNNPDKIIFVGEALVGNEAVDQLTKFDRALRDFSAASGGQERGIDGMLVTKWDTVDDKVGAALSMTYVTGQPIIFVGCGQTYTDLRQLRVANVVEAILGD
ncbi:signal recognition particle binding protein [Epithele typhae]|uniref:signal recognition particle binding protein n=1 Tax=Epithele typhae TaxID=378194 RepID=UPI002008D658|nr:signal recognition particle binding protein [Epithele typhae]KAH9946210.1 signal recognition particle binding protein [Epithele typhae]